MQVGDVTVKSVNDEDITQGAQAMQRPRDRSRKLLVLENPGFEFEHEQQDDPGERIDRRGIGLDEVEHRNAIRELQFGRSVFLDKEQVNVEGQQRVNRVLE